jgi:Family of unknown function (DUF695)
MNKILHLILILNFSSLFSQSNKDKLELNDSWFGSSASENNKPIIVRGREFLKNFKESGKYSERVEIVWTIENSTENGVPTPEENIIMGKIEDAFVNILEKDLHGVLAIVYTHNNIRSWIYYTKSLKEFMNRLNSALSKFEKLPISISNSRDKEWKMYEEFLEVYKN